MKQNNISTVIFVDQVSRLLMRPVPFARKSGCLNICLHNEVRVVSNIVCINHKDSYMLLSSLRMKNSNRKYKLRTGL